MNKSYESTADQARTNLYQEMESLIKKSPWGWQSVCAVIGLVGGVIAPCLGATCHVLTWFVSSLAVNSYLNVLSGVFCALTIPLLILSAFCLDALEAKTAHLCSPDEPLRNEATPAAVVRLVTQQHAHHGLNRTGAVAMLVFLLALPASTYAQQTIFNVPTTDVLDKGKVYAELDVPFKPNDGDSVGKFSSFVPRVVVGAGGRTEVGLNVTGNIQPGADVTSLVPTVKFKLYDGGDNGYDLVVGDNLTIPVRNRNLVSYDVGNYVYLNGSKVIGKTRLTAGGYHFSRGVVAADAQRAGGQFGIEQTILPRFTVAADWITGKHAAGYFTPGFYFKPDKAGKITGYVAYSIGNTNVSGGNHFFLLEVGYNFN